MYDVSLIRIRYVVLVRDKGYCFLCNNRVGANDVKSLKNYTFKKIPENNSILKGNKYEKAVVESYLTLNGITVQEAWDRWLKEWVIDDKAYIEYHFFF